MKLVLASHPLYLVWPAGLRRWPVARDTLSSIIPLTTWLRIGFLISGDSAPARHQVARLPGLHYFPLRLAL